MALRASCDLVLGLQVAHTSNELARIQSAKEEKHREWTAGVGVVGRLEDGEVTPIFSGVVEGVGENYCFQALRAGWKTNMKEY